ncbi:MAG TPA: hypothetical protein VIM57_11405 [Luteolibacter sp.]
MKPLHFLPPAVALLLAGLWIGGQRRSIATLDEESDLLEKHLVAARSATGTEETGREKSGPVGGTAPGKTPINWKQAASLFTEMRRGGVHDMRTMVRFQQQLMALTPDELNAALKEIQALGLPEETRMMLESSILGQLTEKAPEMALKSFFNERDDQRGVMGWQLSRALAAWAKKDVVAATAWFDQQIAAGAFESKSLDGKSRTRMQFEGSMLGVLLSSDPEAAARRLENLPQDQRKDVLVGMLPDEIKEKDQTAFAKLIREQLPEKDRIEAIAQAARIDTPDDYSKATGYMKRIEASTAERNACIDEAADSSFSRISYQRKITPEDVEKLRAWTGSVAPEATDRATGKALASALNGRNKQGFFELADLAEQYHQAGGGDEVIIPLLESWGARKNKERARKLAEGVADEKRRNEFLKEFN